MTMLSIPSFDGHEFHAYLAAPAHASAPAILVCQEIFGVNANMRRVCDELAAQGYLAVCPDLFWRLQPGLALDDNNPDDLQRAFDLFGQFNSEIGMVDLLATLAAIRKLPGCNGAVGTLGYCLGGKLAYLLMTRSDIECGVSYYGVGLEGLLSELPDVRRPLLLHIAGQDEYVPPEAQAQILRAVGKYPQVTAAVYDGVGHAFARPQGKHFDAVAAALANQRTQQFFAEHLTR